MSKITERIFEQICTIQRHIKVVEDALSFVLTRNRYDRGREEWHSLRQELIKQELEAWRDLCMWGLTVSQKVRDRIKAMVHDRFLGKESSVSRWLTEDGREPRMWLHADEETFREMVRKAFAPRLTDAEMEKIRKWQVMLREDHGVHYPDLAAAVWIIEKIFKLDDEEEEEFVQVEEEGA